MLVDLDSLRCFEAAAARLNFRAAARSVGLSPAAFGERIKRLEELLEARLFERTTRKVTLTPAGERLLPRARSCMGQARACVEVVRDADTPTPFDFTLGTRFELGMSWVTPALTTLEKRRPERQLHLLFGDTPALLEALHRDEADCIITSARIASHGLEYARLHVERYAFVASPKLLASKPLKRHEHCRTHTLLELNRKMPLFRYFLDARPGHEVWSFDRVQFLGTIGPVRQRVLAGAGVAVLPKYFIAADLKAKRLTAVMPSVKLPVDSFRLVWRADHARQEELRNLAGELSELPLK